MADRVRTYSRRPQPFVVEWVVGANDLGEPILASEDRDTLRKAENLARKYNGRIFERETLVKLDRETWDAEEVCVADRMSDD